MMEDYYAILGVSPNASEEQIKQAYRRLIRQWHPDVCTRPDAHEQSVKIIQAHKILSDPVARGEYDRLRNYRQRTHAGPDASRERTAYSRHESSFARTQEAARQYAEEFVQKTLEELLGMLLAAGRVVWQGEKTIRDGKLPFGTRMYIGLRGFALLLTIILTFTGVAAPVTVPLGFFIVNSLYHKRHYIGIGNLLSSTLLFTAFLAFAFGLIIFMVSR